MMLRNFEYSEHSDDDRYWAIRSFELGKINLFAARNATGKTRTIKAVNRLGATVRGGVFSECATYDVELADGVGNYQYHLSSDDKKVKSEIITENGATLDGGSDNPVEVFPPGRIGLTMNSGKTFWGP